MIPTYSFKEVCSQKELLELKSQVLNRTWDGKPSQISQKYILALDPEHIYLVGFWPEDADFDQSLEAGSFHKGLWQRDVLELFLKDDESGEYQEFNLSPGGAWWTAVFSGPRVVKGEGKEEGSGEQFLESAVCYRQTDIGSQQSVRKDLIRRGGFQTRPQVEISEYDGRVWNPPLLDLSDRFQQSESVISDQPSDSESSFIRPIVDSRSQTAETRHYPNTHCSILAISRNKLGVKVSFSERSRINVTACVSSARAGEPGARIYLSAAKLEGAVPDFHQPDCFLSVSF